MGPAGIVDLVKSFVFNAVNSECDTVELFVNDMVGIMIDDEASPEKQEEAKRMIEFVIQYPDFVSAYFTGRLVRDISFGIEELGFVLRPYFYRKT